MDGKIYKLIPEDGKHLADSRGTEGALRGVYLDDETNKPCGAAEFLPIDGDTPDEDLEGDDFGIAGILAIGIGIGVVATKVYPHVKKWVTTTAVPGVKKFWQKVSQKEMEQDAQRPETEGSLVLMELEDFSQNIDSVVDEFYADMSSKEAQQHLFNIMCAAMYMASEIRQLSKAAIKDEDRKVWEVAMGKLAAQSVIDGINRILAENVQALDAEYTKTLNEYLGGALIEDGVFVPIENSRIREALLAFPSEQQAK